MHRHAALMLSFTLFFSSTALADQAGTHVRPTDATVAGALSRGYTSSPSFRDLINRLNAADVIVHVERGPFAQPCDGQTRFIAMAGGYRFLRITVHSDIIGDALVGLIGHELQHAVEVADAPWVADLNGYRALFVRIGRARARCEARASCFETDAAVAAGYRVVEELQRHEAPRAVASRNGSELHEGTTRSW